jgi:hypothetical protein
VYPVLLAKFFVVLSSSRDLTPVLCDVTRTGERGQRFQNLTKIWVFSKGKNWFRAFAGFLVFLLSCRRFISLSLSSTSSLEEEEMEEGRGLYVYTWPSLFARREMKTHVEYLALLLSSYQAAQLNKMR